MTVLTTSFKDRQAARESAAMRFSFRNVLWYGRFRLECSWRGIRFGQVIERDGLICLTIQKNQHYPDELVSVEGFDTPEQAVKVLREFAARFLLMRRAGRRAIKKVIEESKRIMAEDEERRKAKIMNFKPAPAPPRRTSPYARTKRLKAYAELEY